MTEQLATAGEAAAPKLLRNRNFLLLWGSQTAGEVGAQIATVAVPLLALGTLNATVFQVAVLTSLAWFPYLVFSLPAGIIVDRFDTRTLMIGCDLGRLALLMAIPVAWWFDALSLWFLGTVIFTSGILTVLFRVCYQTYLPAVVPDHQLVDGNAKIAISTEVSELVGPSASGVLVGLVGAARTFLATGVMYLLSAVLLFLVRGDSARGQKRDEEDEGPIREQIVGGMRFIRGTPALRSILACTTTSNFFVMASGAIEVTFLVREIHLSPGLVGLVFTISALGGIATGLMAERLANWIGDARIIWVAMAAPGPLYLLMPLSQPGWGVLTFGLGLAAFSVNVVLYNTAATSFQQRITPEHLLGRVNATVMWVSLSVVPIGALVGGYLGTLLGLRTALVVCVFGMWSASLWVIFSPLRRLKNISDSPDYAGSAA